jgi:non-ribosomal peptide synthetase component E (peptide arylation enzyme)
VRALSPAFSREKSIAARSITSSETLTIRIEEIAFVRAQNKRKNRAFVRDKIDLCRQKIFESILVAHSQVSEAAAIGIPDSIKGEALICFCVLKKDANGDAALATELKQSVARDLGKALAPKEIVFVGDIPKTRNAKAMRRIVRAAYLAEKLGDTSALENPASLDQIKRAAAT